MREASRRRSILSALADAGDLVKLGGFDSLAAQRPVITYGEAVGFVADFLQKLQGRRRSRDAYRLGAAGQVDLLETLGQGGARLVGDAQFA